MTKTIPTTVRNVTASAHMDTGATIELDQILSIAIDGPMVTYELYKENVGKSGKINHVTIRLGPFESCMVSVDPPSIIRAGDNIHIYQPVSVTFSDDR